MYTDQILCGEAASLLSSCQAESVDLVVTDPPYLVGYKDREGRTLLNDDNPQGVLPVYEQLFRVLKDNSYCISFYGWNAIAAFSQAWEQAGFRTIGHIVWPKSYTSKAGHMQYRHESAFVLAKGFPRKPDNPISDVQSWVYSGNRAHPTEKAVGILAPLIRSFSRPGDLVLDPFSGSGSTAVAAALNDRRYLAIELEERYCTLARKRLAGVATSAALTAAA